MVIRDAGLGHSICAAGVDLCESNKQRLLFYAREMAEPAKFLFCCALGACIPSPPGHSIASWAPASPKPCSALRCVTALLLLQAVGASQEATSRSWSAPAATAAHACGAHWHCCILNNAWPITHGRDASCAPVRSLRCQCRTAVHLDMRPMSQGCGYTLVVWPQPVRSAACSQTTPSPR